MRIKLYLKAMRPHHYIKNLLILFPIICSGQLFESRYLLCGIIGVLAFCFLSSSVYVFNDINDIPTDSIHCTKKDRPIACGKILTKNAWRFAAVLLSASLILNTAACLYIQSIFPALLFFLYLGLNIGYSLGFKNIPLLDVIILVSGFLIRTLYGAYLTTIPISNWLYLFITFTAFYLGFGKRRNELKHSTETNTKNSPKRYPYSFLDKNMYISMALVIVFYSLWTMDSSTVSTYHSNTLVWTVPIIVIILMKYSLTIEGNSDGDPVEVFFKDKILMSLVLIYMAVMLIILYAF